MKFRILFAAYCSVIAGVSGVPANAQEGFTGPYLAARHAIIVSDYAEASRYYRQAISAVPGSLPLMENAILAMVGEGDMDEAIRVAKLHQKAGGKNSVATIVLDAALFFDENYAQAGMAPEGAKGVALLVSGLLRSWALLGQGQMSEALKEFDKIAETEDFAQIANYHRALAFASVGDYESANAILSGETYGPLTLSLRGVEAHAQILAQLDRTKDAIELLDAAAQNGYSSELSALRKKLEAGDTVEYSFVKGAKEGAAEVYFNLSALLSGRSPSEHALLYARLAQYLRPDHPLANLTIADILMQAEQYDLAIEAYSNIPASEPAYVLAELGRADALFDADREDASIEVLTALSKSHKDVAIVFSSLGDMLGRVERNSEAITAYSKAAELEPDTSPVLWRLYYARGIVHERLKDFTAMERDFRKALELSPNQPDVLNYLGYSLVEQKIKLDEALSMIETAVKERPESGHIIDSLGWVFFRLGRYQDAVAPIERATKLLPTDPIVNDHLGDVYWMVGRKREAEFQWKRALSFDPEEDDALLIKDKLANGLQIKDSAEGQTKAAENTQTTAKD